MAKLLKDLYNKNYINLLTKNIHLNYADLQTKKFKNAIFDKTWNDKELKQRMRHIAITMGSFLPQNYIQSIIILKSTFLLMNYSHRLENIIFQDFVEVYGLNDFTNSMDALACFTLKCSSEFAIRQFIIKYPSRSIKQMKIWAKSSNKDLRRLASEGTRPRLPWAIALPKFKKDPTLILPILEILKNDKSEYVRRSVANNLNDISKNNPHIVKNISKKWLGQNENLDKLVKHGCRTLLKQSDQETLALFGFMAKDLQIKNFCLTQTIKLEKDLHFAFQLNSVKEFGKLRIEYAIDFVRLNNKINRKVFKISEGNYSTKLKQINKKHSFKKISTRKYYPGKHQINIIINGIILFQHFFELV